MEHVLECSISSGTPAEYPAEELLPQEFRELRRLVGLGLEKNRDAISAIVSKYLSAIFIIQEVNGCENVFTSDDDEIEASSIILDDISYSDSSIPSVSATAYFPIRLAEGVIDIDDEDLALNHDIRLSDGLAFSWWIDEVDEDMGLYSHAGVSIKLAHPNEA